MVARLQRLGLEPGRRVHFSGEKAVAFAARLDNFHAGDIRGDAHERYYLAPPMAADISIGDDGDVKVAFTSDGEHADPKRVMRAWQRGLNLAPLEGGGWAPLPHDWLQRFGSQVANLLMAKEGRDELPAFAGLDVLALCDALDQPPPPQFEPLRAVLSDYAGLPKAQLPVDLQAKLRDYQRIGVDWLAFLRDAGLGAMLADDMGLGKTLQALTVLQGRSLVVAPTSVIRNWALEAQRFRPSLRVSVYHGPRRVLDDDADLVITTYAIMRLDLEALAAVVWDTVVLDEAQTIKNPASQVARAAFSLKARWRLTLTGTPVENRLDDLWSQMHFTNPGLWAVGRPLDNATRGRLATAMPWRRRGYERGFAPSFCVG